MFPILIFDTSKICVRCPGGFLEQILRLTMFVDVGMSLPGYPGAPFPKRDTFAHRVTPPRAAAAVDF